MILSPHRSDYVRSDERGILKVDVTLPTNATNPIAVLTASGYDYQDNSFNTSAYQYWGEISSDGVVRIKRIKAGIYRLTIYADGVFGDWVMDGVTIESGKESYLTVDWKPICSGKELWRIGIPDKSSGEYRHGNQLDQTHPLHPPEYKIYWGAYDFINDYPKGVNFKIGKDDPSTGLNYIHWSVFGGYANENRPVQVEGNGNINNWTLTFDLNEDEKQLVSKGLKKNVATFTIQLAGAKSAAGNTDNFNETQLWNDLPLTVVINGKELEPWVIP